MKNLASILAFALLLGMTCIARAEYVIKFSHAAGSATAKGRAADFFAEQVNARLAGKVRVEVFPEARLHDDAGVLEALRRARGDTGIMAAPRISDFAELAAGLGVFDLPFLFDSIEDVHRLVDSPVGAELLQPLEDNGLKGLAIWDEGMKVFSVRGTRPLRTPPEDFQGKKFASSDNELCSAMIESLGGTAQALPVAQLFGALSEGSLDGQEGVWSRTYTSKLYEVQDWISVSDHLYCGFLLVIGAEFWSGLPDEIRGELTDILEESTLKAREYAAQVEAEDRKRIEESGYAIVLGLTSRERNEWRNATAEVEKRFAALIGEDLIAEIRALLEQPLFAPQEQPESGAAEAPQPPASFTAPTR